MKTRFKDFLCEYKVIDMEDVKNLIGKDAQIINPSNALANLVHNKIKILPWDKKPGDKPIPFDELKDEKLIDNIYIKYFSDTALSDKLIFIIDDAMVLDYLPNDTKDDPAADRVVIIKLGFKNSFYYRLDNFKIYKPREFNPADPYNEERWEED